MRSVELAPGIMANVEPDVSWATVAELRIMALDLRHREIHGWLSGEPLEIRDGIDYENAFIADSVLELQRAYLALGDELRVATRTIADLKLQLAAAQASCDHCWEFVDDSFDHEFGCHVVRFMRCDKCGKQKDWEDEGPEPDYDAERPLTPLENWQRNDERNVR